MRPTEHMENVNFQKESLQKTMEESQREADRAAQELRNAENLRIAELNQRDFSVSWLGDIQSFQKNASFNHPFSQSLDKKKSTKRLWRRKRN